MLKWAQELREDVIFGREKVALLVYAKFAILLSYSHSVVMLHSKSTPLTLFFLYYTFHLKCKVVCSCVCVCFFIFIFAWVRSFLLYMNLNGCSPIFTILFWFLGFHHKPPNMSLWLWVFFLFLGNYYHERDFGSNSKWNIYVDFWISWTLSSCMQTNWKINDWDFFCLAWIMR